MSPTLAELRQSFSGPGRLDWIGLRPKRKQPPEEVLSAEITGAGLRGDHGRSGKRAVTLIQSEHLPVIGALSGQGEVTAAMLRRNLSISGLNLSALRGLELRIGEAVLEITVPCAPCSRMEQILGQGGYNAMRGHGGWCARVVQPGLISVGDAVQPVL